MSERQTIRVMIVDDHPVVRSGLAAIISDQADLEVVAQAASVADAVVQFRSLLPDVSLIDLSLPDGSGIDLIARLRSLSKRAYFLVLTVHTGGSDIQRALDAGAHAYLLKNSGCEDLVGAIRTVARGGRYLSPQLGRLADGLTSGSDLTARELDVLQWLARGHSNRQIGTHLGITEETVKSHIKHILSKIGVATRSQAIAHCLKSGLLHSDQL